MSTLFSACIFLFPSQNESHSFPCTLAIATLPLCRHRNTAPSDHGLKVLMLWVQITFPSLSLFMSETFHVDKSLSSQSYLAEFLLSVISSLISAVWEVVPCKGECLYGENGDSMRLEDEAAL